MVRIVDYKTRENELGEAFFALILEGDVEMVKSESSGRFYATARRCSIPSTFNEETCKQMIGQQLLGTIERVDTDPYDYEIPETGELISLAHSYEYRPEPRMEDQVFANDNGSSHLELQD